ncbi:MAG: trypsin-like serine protease [Firmicutes bacterium]|nr:trypsin-like serine protease [Bacillota bacterium]
MQAKKRVLTLLSVILAFLAISAVISHLSPEQALGAGESDNSDLGLVETKITPPIHGDNPYIIADIAELASPATVFIYVEWPLPEQPQRRAVPRDPFSFFFDYWFDDPFFSPRQRTQPSSAGSGFIINEEGIILTNQHVVGNRGEDQTITVVVDAPGLEREYQAEIVGADSTLDLAVLKISNGNDQPFPTVSLGDSEKSRIGEWTIAIGNPYGRDFEHTVTVGVLSAKGREITIGNPETGETQIYKNLMQTDAAINRGNSGGPLLNIKGEVIGINTAVHSQAQGIGFAIPINVAKEVLDELIETGGVDHKLEPLPWLGIWYQNLTDSLAGQLQIPDEKGVIVSDVIKGSPAEKGGLQPWDVIRRIGNRDIFDTSDVAEEISKHEPGDEILITVYRGGQVQLLTIVLGDKPANLRD